MSSSVREAANQTGPRGGAERDSFLFSVPVTDRVGRAIITRHRQHVQHSMTQEGDWMARRREQARVKQA